ncbi:MAG: carbamoyltransferase HypF [Deltaproteobacteria bacterium]|nr:carbamoyltransferase HypF [Deltaproteobacteria bacterium]
MLVLGVGNPSRGDDALGPTVIERLGEVLADEVAAGRMELLTDFQLQVEHALDLAGRARVCFVDASVSAAAPFSWSRLEPRDDASATSHAMSPGAALATLLRLGGAPPEAWVRGVRAERFELGEALSPAAAGHCDAAVRHLVGWARGEAAGPSGRRFELEGVVQGVGFRPFVAREAAALGLTGRVFNTARGVTIEVHGSEAALEAMREALATRLPAAARVEVARVTPLPYDQEAAGFTIAGSVAGGATRMALPPDLAACDACLAEVADPADRHFGYVFTSCTECGPRLSIALALPYDRAATTMGEFRMCRACADEYAKIDDRRHHAQTVACPACGPRVWLADADGRELAADDALLAVAERLRAGEIAALQGHGAFHLACDATREDVVAELRRRKRRELRPFAIMVADLASAEALADLDPDQRAALVSPARPIVLAPARPGATLAGSVNGPSAKVGVMLPSTPLHHRLMRLVGRPLVMTSGNVSGQPVVIDHAGSRAALGAIVDVMLLHDRPIARRVEDSIVTRGGRVLRRARGLAPEAIRLPVAAPEPVLALGGHMKNTVCVVVDDRAWLSPHLGDLDTVEAEESWLADLASLERLLAVSPEVVAHDLHPDYTTTRLAMARRSRRVIGVQHHAAHVYAAIAELRLNEPVIGLAFDGTGFGLDGTSWGGEVLLVDGAAWWRVATLAPLPLPGGEAAIRQVWRQALAALVAAFGPEALAVAARLPAFAEVPAATLASVERMVTTGVGCAPARGLGRWFDAVGALVLGLGRAGFDGHVPMALEDAMGDVRPHEVDPYIMIQPITLGEPVAPERVPFELDLAPIVRQVVGDVLAGAPRALVAARFHRTIIEASARLADAALALTGARLVVPTGGSLQNEALARGIASRVAVAAPRAVPVNDGGLALGQALAAVMALGASTGHNAARQGGG